MSVVASLSAVPQLPSEKDARTHPHTTGLFGNLVTKILSSAIEYYGGESIDYCHWLQETKVNSVRLQSECSHFCGATGTSPNMLRKSSFGNISCIGLTDLEMEVQNLRCWSACNPEPGCPSW